MDAERSGVAFLVYRDGDGRQRIHLLEEGGSRPVTVGRDFGADVSLGWDAEVSGVHAEVARVGDDWAIVDDGLSRNGTFVNGERLRGRHRLRKGDTLRFGQTIAVYHSPAGGLATTRIATDAQAAASKVSKTQRRVLVALCRPFKDAPAFATPATNQQIADELFLSVDAVKTHLRLLFQKFGVADLPQNEKRARLVELALQSGLISEREL